MQDNYKIKKNKKALNNGLWFYVILLIIPITQFAIFYIGVNINSILLAFKEYRYIDGKPITLWVNFDNFKRFIGDISEGSILLYTIKNSLKMYVYSLFVGTVLSLLFSFYIAKKQFGYSLIRVLLFLPSMLSSMVMALIFLNMSKSVFPLIIGFDPLSSANVETQFYAIIFFNLWSGFGSGVLLYSNAMSAVSPEIIEAAKLDGANDFKEFTHIVFPTIFPTFTTFMITSVAGIFINQAALYNFYGPDAIPQVQVLGYFLFNRVVGRATMVEYPYASAAGLILTFVAVPITFLVKFVLEKLGPSEE